jgi:hypothetical protein
VPDVGAVHHLRTPAWDPNTGARRSRAPRCVGTRFASPHAVRRSLTNVLQSPALFGGIFRCARSDYGRLTPKVTSRRQISLPQVGRSHNPLVAGRTLKQAERRRGQPRPRFQLRVPIRHSHPLTPSSRVRLRPASRRQRPHQKRDSAHSNEPLPAKYSDC